MGFWQETCFGLNSASIIDVACKESLIGGKLGSMGTPSNFLCLLLKTLQIKPSKEIILFMFLSETFAYIRILSAFYVRLTMSFSNTIKILNKCLCDYRKVKLISSISSIK